MELPTDSSVFDVRGWWCGGGAWGCCCVVCTVCCVLNGMFMCACYNVTAVSGWNAWDPRSAYEVCVSSSGFTLFLEV